MASKLSRQVITVCSSLAFIGGCTQILGISDYEVDPKLDGTGAGDAAGQGGSGDTGTSGSAGTKPSGGTKNDAGSPNGGQPQGGAPEPGTAGSSMTGDAGAGGDAPVVGTVVAADSAEKCTELGGKAVGVEMLKDGGFELGTVGDGDSPWTQLSTNSYEVITNDPDFGFDPHAGTYYAYLSGLQGERSTLYTEPLTIPSDAGWLVVSGYRLFQIDVQDAVNADFCGIGFYAIPPNDALEIPFYWSDPASSTDGWGDSPNWKRFEASWDAAPHKGQKRKLGLVAESDTYPDKATAAPDDTLASSYLFDDVSLKVFRCYK
jgi:hypothetical protein